MAVGDAVRGLAEAAVDGPLQAGAFFRPRIDMGRAPNAGYGIFLALEWLARMAVHLLRREPSIHLLPRPSYIAVTATSVYALAFSFGATVSLRRKAAQWDRSEVTGRRTTDQPFWLDLAVAGLGVAKLEAIDPGPEAEAVIDALTADS